MLRELFQHELFLTYTRVGVYVNMMLETHPNHTEILPRLRRAQGQLAGIEKMIQERRYCVDILIQFKAVMSALRVAEASIYERHVRSCLKDAMGAKDPQIVDKRINELVALFLKA